MSNKLFDYTSEFRLRHNGPQADDINSMLETQTKEMFKDMPPMKRSDVLNNILALNP